MVSLGRAFMSRNRPSSWSTRPSLGLAPKISKSVVEALMRIDIGNGA